jgi:hypothetical protein
VVACRLGGKGVDGLISGGDTIFLPLLLVRLFPAVISCFRRSIFVYSVKAGKIWFRYFHLADPVNRC